MHHVWIWMKRQPFNFCGYSINQISVKTLQTSIYRKAACDGRWWQFSSFTPVTYKRELDWTLFSGVKEICTHGEVEHEEEFIKGRCRPVFIQQT